MTMIGKKSLSISSIGHFRHATLLFTALLLIVTNGCAAGEKVDLKDRCMKYPLHLMCRGSVMKRGVPKIRNLDMIFDDFIRSKIPRSTSEWEEYPHRRNNLLSRLTKKERNDLYDYYMSTKQAQHTNRSKLFDSLLPGRIARDANDANPAVGFISFLENLEYK